MIRFKCCLPFWYNSFHSCFFEFRRNWKNLSYKNFHFLRFSKIMTFRYFTQFFFVYENSKIFQLKQVFCSTRALWKTIKTSLPHNSFIKICNSNVPKPITSFSTRKIHHYPFTFCSSSPKIRPISRLIIPYTIKHTYITHLWSTHPPHKRTYTLQP